MATDVDRLRIIYELDDLPAAKAFRRLREEAERTNAAITGGATRKCCAIPAVSRWPTEVTTCG